MIPAWVADYIGIPFLSLGRDRKGLDCYGLVRLILCEKYNVFWPAFNNEYTDAQNKDETSRVISKYKSMLQGERVTVPQIGDIVLMKYMNYPCHMGMFIGENRIIHIEPGINSVVDRLDSIKLKSRIEGYYNVR